MYTKFLFPSLQIKFYWNRGYTDLFTLSMAAFALTKGELSNDNRTIGLAKPYLTDRIHQSKRKHTEFLQVEAGFVFLFNTSLANFLLMRQNARPCHSVFLDI